ncbi:hypothetical protein [Lentibacillus salicampi]|uniref:Type II toxin-antitoxin system RelE/ParE family toxin n=1 Tax=Lentibacillus salicampi TaxID=175306 RepID=A0A4Y9A9X1_9BACI|nr:hypothetical protein [Lentibacillus salicampi]TFJ91967.1 hypothetical protein E4U82_14800 [Lentibacillus salicampi]
MGTKNIIWLPIVREKLLQFRSEHFTAEETLEFIFKLIIDIEELLKNEFVGKTYIEEFGDYKGLSRIVFRKFRVYYEKDQDNIIVLGILFPGEK